MAEPTTFEIHQGNVVRLDGVEGRAGGRDEEAPLLMTDAH